jgi:hypothetical protein
VRDCATQSLSRNRGITGKTRTQNTTGGRAGHACDWRGIAAGSDQRPIDDDDGPPPGCFGVAVDVASRLATVSIAARHTEGITDPGLPGEPSQGPLAGATGAGAWRWEEERHAVKEDFG